MEKMEKGNPNSQPAQSQLLSLQRRPGVRDEAGRRGRWMDRAGMFAVPVEPDLSHEVMAERALLGGMDRDSRSSPKLPQEKQVSSHQKVLEWLEANFRTYGDEEEEENEADRQQKLSHLKWCKEKVEARWQELVAAVSSVGSNEDDNALSRWRHYRAQGVSQGEVPIQDSIQDDPLGMVEESSISRPVGTEVTAVSVQAVPSTSLALWSDTELAAASLTRVTEEEQPPLPLALEDEKAAAPVLSEERTPGGTRSPLPVFFNTAEGSQAQLFISQKMPRGNLLKSMSAMKALRQQQKEGESPETALHSRSQTPSPARHGRSHTPSPALHGRSHTPSPALHGRSHTPSPALHGRSHTPSPALHGRSHTPSPALHSQSETLSPALHSSLESPSHTLRSPGKRRPRWAENPEPAMFSMPRPPPLQRGALALRGQPAAPSPPPSRFRRGLRALRGLFWAPCLRLQPEE